jgi:inorganic triphosphatase YgiF
MQHVETEFKFRVPADFVMPSFPQSLGTWDSQPIRNMDATYWDTTDATLLRWGITMRLRTGGGDDGWHVKIPTSTHEQAGGISGASVRTELHRDATTATPPSDFVELLSAILQGSEVVAIARVQTHRVPQVLSGSNYKLIELVDDHVTLSREGRVVEEFREIEIELLDAKAMAVALDLSEILRTAGAQASSVSKAANAFGPAAGKQPDIPLLPAPTKTDLPCDLIRWAFSRSVREIFHAELTSRITHDSTNLTRKLIALQRLINALRNWLSQDELEFLNEDLEWLIRELSFAAVLARQRERALGILESLPDPLDRHEATTAVEQYFVDKGEAARSSVQAARRSDRYLLIFSDLINLGRVPAVTPAAYEPISIWDRISQDPCDQLAIAEHFRDIYKKRSKRIRKNLVCSDPVIQPTDIVQPIEAEPLIRSIALSGKVDPAAIFALGLSLGGEHEA